MGRAVCAEMVGPWLCGLWERSRSILDTFGGHFGASGPSRAVAEAAWEGLGASQAARRGSQGSPGRLLRPPGTALEASWDGLEASRMALEASWRAVQDRPGRQTSKSIEKSCLGHPIWAPKWNPKMDPKMKPAIL